MQGERLSFKKIVLLILIAVGSFWLFQNYTGVLGVFGKAWALLWPIVLSIMIAFVLNLPMRAIEKHLFRGKGGKLKRPISFVLALLFVLLLIFFLIFMVGPELIRAIQKLFNAMPGYWSSFVKSLTPYEKYIPQIQNYVSDIDLDWASMTKKALSFVQSGAGGVVNSAVGFASSFISSTVSFFIAFILAVYILLDKEHVLAQTKGICQAYLPKKAYQKFRSFMMLCNQMFSKFITGQCMEGLAIGTIFTIVLFIGQFDYPLLIGVLIGFMSLIPVFGTTVACIIGALLLLMSQGFARALIFVIIFLIIQQLDGNFMYPYIVGTSVGLPAMWVMVSVTIGGSLMGVAGMFICIPIASIFYTLVRQNAIARLEKKGIESPVAVLAANTPPPKPKKPKKNKNSISDSKKDSSDNQE